VIPSKKWVFYLSDEIFAIHAPILVTIDARSTAIPAHPLVASFFVYTRPALGV